MAKRLLTCWLCGAEHEYCPTCGQTHGWRYMADTREHYQILMAKRNYESGVFDKEHTTEILADFGIKPESDLSWMIPEVEKEIRDIIGEKPVKAIKKTKSKLFE